MCFQIEIHYGFRWNQLEKHVNANILMSSSWIRSTVDPRTKCIFTPKWPDSEPMIVWKSVRKKGNRSGERISEMNHQLHSPIRCLYPYWPDYSNLLGTYLLSTIRAFRTGDPRWIRGVDKITELYVFTRNWLFSTSFKSRSFNWTSRWHRSGKTFNFCVVFDRKCRYSLNFVSIS